MSEYNSSIGELQELENELNSIFIELYGLGNTLSPGTQRSDVAIPDMDTKNIISDLISYCTGLYFGRFSADGGIVEVYSPCSASVETISVYIIKYITKIFGDNACACAEAILGTDIRDYMQNQFIKDHTKKYKNCPVYYQKGDTIEYKLGDDTPCLDTQQ